MFEMCSVKFSSTLFVGMWNGGAPGWNYESLADGNRLMANKYARYHAQDSGRRGRGSLPSPPTPPLSTVYLRSHGRMCCILRRVCSVDAGRHAGFPAGPRLLLCAWHLLLCTRHLLLQSSGHGQSQRHTGCSNGTGRDAIFAAAAALLYVYSLQSTVYL
jgi:hypothetical protein